MGDDDPLDEIAFRPVHLGWATGTVNFMLCTLVGHWVLDDATLGLVAGVLTGLGAHLLLPYLLRWQLSRDGYDYRTDAGPNGLHRGAAGVAFVAGGVVALVAGFVLAGTVPSVAAGLALAVACYLLLSRLVDAEPAGDHAAA